jgi:hypothetical protein
MKGAMCSISIDKGSNFSACIDKGSDVQRLY